MLENPSSAPMIGAVEDSFAQADLVRTAEAFRLIQRSKEIKETIELSQVEVDAIGPNAIIAKFCIEGAYRAINTIRNYRAQRLYERGTALLPRIAPID